MTGGSVDIRITRLADAGTVLGQLQRGRGEGFLAAVEMAPTEASDLVWQCIVHDPRYDLQIDSRDWYYANLAQEVGLRVERLRPQNCPTPASDVDQRLVVGVLGELVAVGADGADAVLLDHVANGDEWDDAIYKISRSPGDLYRQLPAVLDARFPEDECVAIVHRWHDEIPWGQIANARPWVKRAIDSFDRRGTARADELPKLPTMDRSAAELLEHPLDDPGGIPAAEVMLRGDASGRGRAEALHYLQNLSGGHTLRLARSWIGKADGRGVAARGIFERHAEASDLPLLVNGLAEAWDVRDFYALCSFIDALARLSDRGSAELISSIYEEAEYSYARRRAARALIAVDVQAFVDRYARSALWDCERGIQDLAIGLLGDQLDAVAARQVKRMDSIQSVI